MQNNEPGAGQTLASITPYELPQRIWDLIEDSFKSMKVEMSESYPQARVTGNVVSWRILRRQPGGNPSGKFRQRGRGFSNILGVDPSGYIFSEYTQEHRMVLEFAIFSTSNSEADTIAWKLEEAIVEAEGPLKKMDPGITLTFAEQIGDDNFQESHEDDIIRRLIRFDATLPVRTVVVEPQINQINQEITVGKRVIRDDKLVRNSDNTIYRIPVSSTEKVHSITDVYIHVNGERVILKQGADYRVKEANDLSVYIEWNDEYGRTPGLGSEFGVIYTLEGRL